jgi:hypothetical protein
MVLTGIALQEGRHVAFIEDSAAHSTKRLVPGDAVAGGSIVAVSIDSVEFEAGGKRIHIPVGRNLLGEIAPVAAAEPSSSSQPAVASSNTPERTAADRSSNGRSRSGSSNGNGSSRDSSRDRNSRDSRNGRDSNNGRDNGRDSRSVSGSPAPRDTLRERDPAAPPVDTTVVLPGSAAAPGLPNDPNLSLEERMRIRAQQLRGENK